ncbi:MAG: hypothetical protein CM1200mP14_04960 [Gammaproteobacteria bacterium]|nr:MAG: hypothetical protein CM1200mP14_04960 [Gammaproteobacteria bacterium]
MNYTKGVFGVLLQYPATDGEVLDYRPFVSRAKEAGSLVIVAADLMALALLTPPGEWGADVVIGNSSALVSPSVVVVHTRHLCQRQIPSSVKCPDVLSEFL